MGTIGAILLFFPATYVVYNGGTRRRVQDFKENTGAMGGYIPEEIFLNILPNVPVQSLLRFRCVSKLWCSSISQIKTHRHKFITASGFSYGRNDKLLLQSIDETTGSVEDIKDLPWEVHKIQIYGSCNGLVLIGYEGDLFLWNPALGCHKKFFSYGRLACIGPYDSYSIVGGLCFDSANNEYKIVMAIRNNNLNNLNRSAQYVVVGSPRNRTWTRSKFPYAVESVFSGPVLNSRLHWIASNLLVYFDTKTDEFVELPMPRPRVDGGNGACGLGVLDGLLCMTRSEGFMSDAVQVLGMLKYGVGESWSILFRFKGFLFRFKGFYPMYGIVPLFCLENDKNKVFVKARENFTDYIFMYDTVAELRTNIISPQREYMGLGVVYEKTLIRPIGYGWEELDSRGEATYVEKVSSKHTVTMKRDDRRVWHIVNHEWEESSEDKETPVSKSTSRRQGRSDRAAGRGSFWSKEKCPW